MDEQIQERVIETCLDPSSLSAMASLSTLVSQIVAVSGGVQSGVVFGGCLMDVMGAIRGTQCTTHLDPTAKGVQTARPPYSSHNDPAANCTPSLPPRRTRIQPRSLRTPIQPRPRSQNLTPDSTATELPGNAARLKHPIRRQILGLIRTRYSSPTTTIPTHPPSLALRLSKPPSPPLPSPSRLPPPHKRRSNATRGRHRAEGWHVPILRLFLFLSPTTTLRPRVSCTIAAPRPLPSRARPVPSSHRRYWRAGFGRRCTPDVGVNRCRRRRGRARAAQSRLGAVLPRAQPASCPRLVPGLALRPNADHHPASVASCAVRRRRRRLAALSATPYPHPYPHPPAAAALRTGTTSQPTTALAATRRCRPASASSGGGAFVCPRPRTRPLSVATPPYPPAAAALRTGGTLRPTTAVADTRRCRSASGGGAFVCPRPRTRGVTAELRNLVRLRFRSRTPQLPSLRTHGLTKIVQTVFLTTYITFLRTS
ncbi:hypothetical protein C8R43DRAFT_1138507 [Mycena crocata]|nr:hypothetical protein C8R43DRAFT_1138507 [Mycena crocata]